MKTKAYIARDKSGNLCIYTSGKPYKYNSFWAVNEPGCPAKISNHLFPEVKWEDEEPTEVNIEIVGKKAQQPQEQQQGKFDPKTLKPFDKVLVKFSKEGRWTRSIFSNELGMSGYECIDYVYQFCIPYNEDTKHLVGTTQEAPKFYKYWEE